MYFEDIIRGVNILVRIRLFRVVLCKVIKIDLNEWVNINIFILIFKNYKDFFKLWIFEYYKEYFKM